jgi:hypothetical protein
LKRTAKFIGSLRDENFRNSQTIFDIASFGKEFVSVADASFFFSHSIHSFIPAPFFAETSKTRIPGRTD